MLSTFMLFALAAPPPVPDLEAEKARAAVAVAVAIAKLNEKKPAPKVDPTPGVVVQSRFTVTGRGITVPPQGAVVPSSLSRAGTGTAPILTFAEYAGQRGSIVRCTSFG